jgi:signal transduction histidine kinase
MTNTPAISSPYYLSLLLIAILFIINFLIEMRFSFEAISKNVWLAVTLIIGELFICTIYLIFIINSEAYLLNVAVLSLVFVPLIFSGAYFGAGLASALGLPIGAIAFISDPNGELFPLTIWMLIGWALGITFQYLQVYGKTYKIISTFIFTVGIAGLFLWLLPPKEIYVSYFEYLFSFGDVQIKKFFLFVPALALAMFIFWLYVTLRKDNRWSLQGTFLLDVLKESNLHKQFLPIIVALVLIASFTWIFIPSILTFNRFIENQFRETTQDYIKQIEKEYTDYQSRIATELGAFQDTPPSDAQLKSLSTKLSLEKISWYANSMDESPSLCFDQRNPLAQCTFADDWALRMATRYPQYFDKDAVLHLYQLNSNKIYLIMRLEQGKFLLVINKTAFIKEIPSFSRFIQIAPGYHIQLVDITGNNNSNPYSDDMGSDIFLGEGATHAQFLRVPYSMSFASQEEGENSDNDIKNWQFTFNIPRAKIAEQLQGVGQLFGGILFTLLVVLSIFIWTLLEKPSTELENITSAAIAWESGNFEKKLERKFNAHSVMRLGNHLENLREKLSRRQKTTENLLEITSILAVADKDISHAIEKTLLQLRNLLGANVVRLKLDPLWLAKTNLPNSFSSGQFPQNLHAFETLLYDQQYISKRLYNSSSDKIKSKAPHVILQPFTPMMILANVVDLERGNVLGLLWAGRQGAEPFARDFEEMLHTVCNHLAVALAKYQADYQQSETLHLLNAVLAVENNPIVVTNDKHQLVMANSRAQEILELPNTLSPDEPMPIQRMYIPKALKDLLISEKVGGNFEDAILDDQNSYHVSRSRVDSFGGYVTIFSNIAQFRAEQERQNMFIKMMLDNIRRPLVKIEGFTHLLGMAGELSSVQQEKLTDIKAEVLSIYEDLDKLVDSLDKTQTEKLDKKECFLNDIVRDEIENVKRRTAQRRIQVVFRSETAIPKIYADKELLGIATRNLLNNALTYTPQYGQVFVKCYTELGKVAVSVQDTGCGIAESDLELIFEPNFRVQSELNKRVTGLGLGLTTARQIARQHLGDIRVQSQLGKGSTFILELPSID